jgi:hypothetical protein
LNHRHKADHHFEDMDQNMSLIVNICLHHKNWLHINSVNVCPEASSIVGYTYNKSETLAHAYIVEMNRGFNDVVFYF